MKKWKIYFVPHTHWDKEWYFTKETSTVFLVDNIQKLKEIVTNPKNFSHHIYDSQMSIIDDYLEFYPEDEKIINEMIKNKKLIVGPWYTQPDMFSPSGESILRNLSIGKHQAIQRGFSAKEAYTPDSFGFNSNLPQILKHNECDAIIQWRGVDSTHLDNDLLNIWEGIDGTKVYLYNMFKYGYGLTFWSFDSVYKKWDINNIKELSLEYINKVKNKREELNILKSKSLTNIVCYPFGSDQSPVIEYLPQFIEEINKLDDENEWILSDYDQFIRDIIEESKKFNVKTIKGELKYGQYSRTHRTIGSSRYDIKSLNKKSEYLLYNISEPLGLIYHKFTNKYQSKIYEKALKWLLESHAHDSLGGSCTDEVNSAVVDRIKKSNNLLISQNTLIKRRIADYLQLTNNDIIIFNLQPLSRKMEIKIKLITRSRNFKLIHNEREISYTFIDSTFYDRKNFEMNYFPLYSNQSSEDGFYESTISLKLDEIEGLSYAILQWEELDDSKFEVIQKLSINKIQNENFKIELLENKYKITDLNNKNEVYAYLEFDHDAGDTYDYSPKQGFLPIQKPEQINYWTEEQNNSKKIITHLTYKIPNKINNNKLIEQDINLTCDLQSNKINFKVNLLNEASECRWRVIIDTKISNSHSYADHASSFIERTNYETERMKKWQEEKWNDMPVAIENFYSFVYVKDNKNRVGIYSNELGEYELIGNDFSKLAITLFRGVPYIGQRGLMYRPGRASGINDYPYKTPESNLNIDLSFEFGLILNDNITKNEISNIYGGFDYFQNQKISDYLLQGKSFWKALVNPIEVNIKPTNIFKDLKKDIIISATKISYDNKNMLIRINNIGLSEYNMEEIISKEYINKIYETNGLEKNRTKLSKTLKPNEIKSLIISL